MIKISIFPILFTGLLCSLCACANELDYKVDLSPISENNICKKQKPVFFRCPSGEDLYILCESVSGGFLFLKGHDQTSSEVFFSGQPEKYFYSNYHRFKVIQNTVSFSSESKKYELFDYSDEESQPPLVEYGLTIAHGEGEPESIYCDDGAVSNISQLEDVISKL